LDLDEILAESPAGDVVYCCGPDPMIRAAKPPARSPESIFT
jgi:ferredoxin-NADP reductase